MSGQQLVSVIVPCYNYGNFLGETLSCLGRQRHAHWECIIVDDGSTDNTKEVAASFTALDARYRYVHQANAGLSAARNKGLAECRGAFVQLLDADDLIHPDKLQLQLGLFDQHPEAAIVYGDALFFHTQTPGAYSKGRNGQPHNGTAYLKGSGTGPEMAERLSRDNFIDVSSPLVRREVFEQVGPFDTSYKSYEDWQFWFRCAVAGLTFRYEPLPGTEAYIRYGHTSMLTNQRKLVTAGIQIRRFMHPSLHGKALRYSHLRMAKLRAKQLLLDLKLIR